jgi:polar amino acid transport system substrate-binding protein
MKKTVLAVVAAVFIALGIQNFLLTKDASNSAQKETAYDRVMRTGVLRCGYAFWPPVFVKDPRSGQYSGVYYDYMELLGKRLKLKIDWAQELSMSTYLEDMKAGKYDVECSGGWPNAQRGKLAEYTTPIFYTPVYLYARKDDKRFDNDYESINKPEVRFVTMIGENSEVYRAEFFPKTTEVSINGTAPIADIVAQLYYNKGDIVFNDEMSSVEFEKTNPGKIRRIQGPAVKVIPDNLSVAKGETKLLSMLNIATEELMNDGSMDRILKKYSLAEPVIYFAAKPYAVSK